MALSRPYALPEKLRVKRGIKLASGFRLRRRCDPLIGTVRGNSEPNNGGPIFQLAGKDDIGHVMRRLKTGCFWGKAHLNPRWSVVQVHGQCSRGVRLFVKRAQAKVATIELYAVKPQSCAYAVIQRNSRAGSIRRILRF